MLGKLPVPGRPTNLDYSRQGPIALGGGCLDIFFSHVSLLFSFSHSLGDGPIQTEILSQRAVKSRTTNRPNVHTTCLH